MNQFWEFFTFELRFRFKTVSTYVYFLLWTVFSFLCVASESFGPVGNSNGKVLLNGPFANTTNDSGACLFGTIIMAAIFGTSILRDFQRDTVQLLFTKPIHKSAYLGGRWLGSMVTTLFAFSGMLLGTLLGTFAPWADHTRIGPNHAWWYLQPFLSMIAVQVFFLGSLFFVIAAITRKIFVVYLQGVAVFMAWIIGVTVYSTTRSLEHFWSGILDPLGTITLDNITRYWTVIEKNTRLLPWDFSGDSPGVFLYNRLLWSAVGLLALLIGWWLFPMSVEALTARSQGRRAAKQQLAVDQEARPVWSLAVATLPVVHQVFGARTTLLQFTSMARLRLRMIFKEIPFWAIVGLLIVFAVNNGRFAGNVGGEHVWPVTYLMLNAVEGSATLFFYIVATLYAAELVWRERDNRFDGIHDALPLNETVDWLSKLTAIAIVELVLLTVTMLVGVMMQTIAGFHHYEFALYFKELFLVVFPQLLGFALLSMFVQTMVSNKFVGHGIVIGIFVIVPILFNFGFENTLLLPGSVPSYTLSDMNGYGHFAPALFWSILYWLAIFGVLGVVSIAYTRRGAEASLLSRTRLAGLRAPGLLPAAALLLLVAIGSGGWFYYNAHVLNAYTTAKTRRHYQADYETNYRKYRAVPQLKVTAVDTAVDIYPNRRSMDATGTFTLQNKTAVPIKEIYLSGDLETKQDVSFDRLSQRTLQGPRNSFSIYRFADPVEPGGLVTMTAKVSHTTRGFRDGNEPAQYAYNGTFFDNGGIFPSIGYQDGAELDDPRRRREEHLGPLHEMADRGDPVYSRQNLFTGQQADWITYHTVVSTTPDQIAISPGYLQREWTKDGRRYFEYSMGSTHIQDFFNYVSGRYQVRRDVYTGPNGPVNIEVYYDPHHPYDLDDMVASSKAGLDYDQQFFSPYQFTQYRIMEFPRYRNFAQSFPNTVPFSEGIGFIGRQEKPTDVDLTYFVTAHELGHQWWGHQLIGGNVQGSNMMSETYAEYTAYMIMQRKYGRDYMHRVLRHFLDRYLRGRAGESRHEPPLSLVQKEPYVWYEKGGQIMYTLADYVGEDRINLALRNFLTQYRYANANNQVDATGHVSGTASASQPYPDTRLLVEALRAQTPPDMQYLIDDGFNRIVLYDNKALSAKWQKRSDGKYDVTLEVQARKVQADGNGVESPMPLNDVIEVGVFTGKKDDEKTLSMRRERMSSAHGTYTFVVDQQPTRAGIDPYNRLIDRIADDNMIDVVKQ